MQVALSGRAGAVALDWFSPELRRIAMERAVLEQTLGRLPPAPEPHFTERLGYHSGYSDSPATVEWVELKLPGTEKLDAVVLVPAISSALGTNAAGYGFPVRFRVETFGDEDHTERSVIADHTTTDFPNPGMLPVYLPAQGRRARFVRITATRLYQEDGRALFALGEVLLLQGRRNLAVRLNRSDFVCSRTMGAMPVWGLANLVDGHSVLGPPEGLQPSPTLGFLSQPVDIALNARPPPRWVRLDLGAEMPVSEVRLFPAHPPEFAHRPGYGFPTSVKVELSLASDFSPSIELPNLQDGSVVRSPTLAGPGDNVLTFPARDQPARYVRVTASRLFDANGRYIFALAEMQVWSGDANLALGKPVTATDPTESGGWAATALVDGFTSRHDILDWPEWLAGLSQQRETLHQLVRLESSEVEVRSRLTVLGWWVLGGTGAAASAAMCFNALWQRRVRRIEMESLRQQISQDLHDEIGSSLGSIALITQDILAADGNAPQTRKDLVEIKDIADETVSAMRDITRLIQSDRYGSDDLATLLRDTAARLLRDIPHTLTIETGSPPRKLPVDRQRDLILIFKEALHNITRHAAATGVDIRLVQNSTQLTVTVHDNGRGFDPSVPVEGMGLTNLRRRAAKHGGRVDIIASAAQGTKLCITLPYHG